MSEFRLEQCLRRDQCGEVWVGANESGEKAVVRVLPLDPASELSRFSLLKREAMMQQRLAQECKQVLEVVATHRGSATTRPYIATACVEAETLEQKLERQGKLNVEETMAIFRQILEALAAAHRTGYSHGDLNAQNVLVEESGKVWVTDFGVARALDVLRGERGTAIQIAFLPPEGNHEMRPASQGDLYALGCLCYQMLTGRPPAPGYQVVWTLDADVPRAVRRLVDRLITPDGDHRLLSYIAVQTELEWSERPRAVVARNSWVREAVAVVFSIAAVLLTLGAVVFAQH